jgi:hypothetical protein
LVTPEKLPYGDGYSNVEVQAPTAIRSTPSRCISTHPGRRFEGGGVTVVEVSVQTGAERNHHISRPARSSPR